MNLNENATVRGTIIEIDETNLESATKTEYKNRFTVFCRFANIHDTAGFVSMPTGQLQQLLTDYAKYNAGLAGKGRISPNTVSNLFKPLKYVLDLNSRENDIKWRPIKSLYPKHVKKSGYKPYTDEHIVEMLACSRLLREKAFIHFMKDTGARPGIHDHSLLYKHLVPMSSTGDSNMDCYAVLLYADMDETPEEKDERIRNGVGDESGDEYSYWSFLTPEGARWLTKYLEQRRQKGESIGPDSPIFRLAHGGNLAVSQMSGTSATSMLHRILKRTSIKRNRMGGRYDIQIGYGFRKRFNTILKINREINPNVAEKLMAHKRGLDATYLKPTREQCFAEFVKAIPDLMIDKAEVDKQRIADQNTKLNEYKKQEVRIRDLEQENKGLKRDMESSLEERMGQARREMEENAGIIDEQDQKIRQLEDEDRHRGRMFEVMQRRLESMEQAQKDAEKRFEQWYESVGKKRPSGAGPA